MKAIPTTSSPQSFLRLTYREHNCSCKIVAKKSKGSQTPPPRSSDPTPPRIKTNLKQNLQFLRLWKEFQKRKSDTPRPATSYRRKRVEKEEMLDDSEIYRDPTLSLYHTNQGLDTAFPVLLVDGYNVCGYWAKLKKYFVNGRLDIARQKLVDELVTFSMLREVKVVVVFDAMMSGLPMHKETFAGIDLVFSAETCADSWIEKEVVALREDGCPKVWVVTSDHCQQHAAHGAGAFVWSSKALVTEDSQTGHSDTHASKSCHKHQSFQGDANVLHSCDALRVVQIKASQKEVEQMLREHRSTSMQGKLLKHNLDSDVVDALKDLRNKLSEN